MAVNVGLHWVDTLFALGDLSVVVEESVVDRLGNGKLLHGGLIPLVRPSVESYLPRCSLPGSEPA